MPLDLTYPAILSSFGGHTVKGGTESRAFLAWFLENYYRLDDVEVYDSVCDGKGDKGVDGIYINEGLRQIDIFQVTLLKAEEKTLGDNKLKGFTGAIAQFSNKSNAELTLSSANAELKAIAKRLGLLDRLSEGFAVRGIFVTNAVADVSATSYLGTQTNLVLFDGIRLKQEYITIEKTDPISSQIEFDISNVPSLPFPIGEKLNMVLAPIAAAELVKMEGIANGDLFAWNVRQWLGRNTTVNKSVSESIKTASEHKYFPAFHNGITVLCKKLEQTKEKISISGYAVVNGCQSLTSLHDNKGNITSDLRILTKFIEVEPDSALATKITDHTNNQNGTTARDLQSNNRIQTRLQSQIHAVYPEYHYRIKRGEHPEWPKASVIENELLARIILAFDLERQEAWSQNYKLFDDLHAEIFARPGVDAHRAVFLYETYGAVVEKLNLLEDQNIANYTLTRWLVLYLVREALKTDSTGTELINNPNKFFSESDGRSRVKLCVGHLAQRMVRIFNSEIARRQKGEEFFDYKKEFKNKEVIFKFRADLIPRYQIIIDDSPTDSFAEKWKGSRIIKAEEITTS